MTSPSLKSALAEQNAHPVRGPQLCQGPRDSPLKRLVPETDVNADVVVFRFMWQRENWLTYT